MKNRGLLLFCLLPLAAGRAWGNMCALPQMNVASAGSLSSSSKSAVISAGLAAGVAVASNMVLSVGLQFSSVGAYTCFLSTDAPAAVAASAGAASLSRLAPSPARTMNLEWTSGWDLLPVSYSVYLGTSPLALAQIASGVQGQSYMLFNLEFLTPYYWQVAAVDQFGRASGSPVYSFSIAPAQSHMIAAPNPFHPGNGGTTFMWTMPGAGSAELEIFSLPDARRVFKVHLEDLQDGVNIYAYDGRESNGQVLPNGVYTAHMRMNGAHGNKTELFKIAGAR